MLGASEQLSPATARQLGSLRVRLAALLGALVLIVVAVLSYVVIGMDRDLRTEQNDATLLRELGQLSREVTFDEGEIAPDDLDDSLDEWAAVAIRPDFDVFDALEEGGPWDDIPDPDEDEIAELVEDVFFNLDRQVQDEALVLAGAEGESRSDRIDDLFDAPPEDLVDEAYRIYLIDTAEDMGLEVESPTTLYVPDETPLAEDRWTWVSELVIDDEESGPFLIEEDDRSFAVRGAVLRDGPEARGAAMVFVDLTSSDAAHADFRNRVVAVAIALVAMSALAAWWLAGRSIRPAATALAQQERFLAAAAHELRTPITAIRATAEAPVGTGDPQVPLARVAELAEGASVLTDDLLTLARMDADRMELERSPLRLDLLVEAIIDGNPAFALQAEPIVFDGDAALLARAIENLLRNAVVHGAANTERPAAVGVSVSGVAVVDHGPGIPEGDLEAIFERFRSGPSSPGHGLGLPLARWIARAHGGDLVAENMAVGARLVLSLAGTRSAAVD